jgi:hypothetical protein
MDHAMEDFPSLIVKWQEKRNQNVQMIVAEENDDRLRVATIMSGGVRT